MNRLIILGNGFDINHGLPSRFEDFMLWYLKPFFKDLELSDHEQDNDLFTFKTSLTKFTDANQFELWKKNNFIDTMDLNSIRSFFKGSMKDSVKFTIKGEFLKTLLIKNGEYKWLDVEQTLFRVLSKYADEYRINKLNVERSLENLNSEFENFKIKLEEYLLSEVNPRIMYSKSETSFLSLFAEPIIIGHTPLFNDPVNEILFLNFNYTSTAEKYIKCMPYELSRRVTRIDIHGLLGNKKNPIIFGSGNATYESNKLIEDTDHDQFLEHFKLIQYFNTDNHQKTMKFVNDKPFEVAIVGHSCGLSDGVLLKSIFESKNCIKILPCYYSEEDFKTRLINIYRHFTDKNMMLDKVLDFNPAYKI